MSERGEYLAYNNGAVKSILFIGSCRLIPLMHYCMQTRLREEYNFYFMAVWMVPKEINSVINIVNDPNLSYVIAEYALNHDILNTERDLTKCKDGKNVWSLGLSLELPCLFLPTLDCHSCLATLVEHDSVLLEEIKQQSNDLFSDTTLFRKIKTLLTASRERLYLNIERSDLPELGSFVKEHFQDIKMLYTINHPTGILCYETAKLVLSKMFNISLDCQMIDPFRGRVVKMCSLDMEYNNYTFQTPLHSLKEILSGQLY